MKKIALAVFGSSGRVGTELIKLALNDKELSLGLGVGRGTTGAFEAEYKTSEGISLRKIDVCIDFSSVELFQESLKLSVENKRPFVSGTTGLTKKDFEALKRASKKIPVLWASNMSLGVATLKKSLEALTQLKGFDIFIEEFHHNKKIDSPSGTAKSLQEKLKELNIKTISEPVGFRCGGIFGIHKVHAVSQEEHLVFEHQALNRAVFAKGALTAAKWIHGKKPGLYYIEDVLG